LDEIPSGLDYSFTPQTKALHLMSTVSGGGPAVSTLVVQPDGKLVIAGYGIIRLNPDGSRDSGFQARLRGNGVLIGQVLVQTDGRILVSDRSAAGLIDLEQVASIVRLNVRGSRDVDFHPDPSFIGVYAMALDATGRILVAGYSRFPFRIGIMRLNSDGSRDRSFAVDDSVPLSGISAIALQTDGRVLIGAVHEFGGRVTRLNTDGSLDFTFGSGTGTVPRGARALALQPDGRVLLGGGTLTRLNSDGSLDAEFDSGSGFDGGVTSVAVQADGKILIAGYFTMAAGRPRVLKPGA
jgi:uncharacterized delta-60 repeat protein